MTADEAIALVKRRAAGRTRYDGELPWLDEVLVEEVERLREENERLRVQNERLGRCP
jgi:hypothetical protein